MAADVVFRKLVTCALVVSLALLHRGSCASLSNIGGSGGGGGGGGNGESTVLGSASSSKLVTPTLGSLYRSTRDEYGRNGGREERCVSCGGGAYGDRDMRTYGGRPGSIYGYYSGQGSIYDDRNWYYRPDSYNGGAAGYQGREGYYQRPSYMNMMMGYDDRYMHQMSPANRYDDRYYPMSMRGYYDNRGGAAAGDHHRMGASGYYPAGADMGMRTGAGYGYRGNGYDNLDPLYEQYMMAARGDRYRGPSGGYGGATAGAVGYEDRYRGMYGSYDHKNFRPWDETYSRPSSPSSSAPSSGGQQQYPSAPSSHSSSFSSSSHQYQQRPGALPPAGHGAPTGPAGTYSSAAIGFHQSSGPDRPDSRPCCAECCGKGGDHGRYPPQSGPTGTGPGYHQQQPQQPHHQQQYGGGERPDAHGRPGAWNYLSGGGATGGQDYHQGASAAGSASHSQPGQDYGNRGGYPQQHHQQQHQQQQRPEASGGDRQQNTAYRPHSRPSAAGLGSTSYLMDRDTGNSVSASQLHSSDDEATLGGGSGSSSSSSSSNDIDNDGKPVVGENPLKSNES